MARVSGVAGGTLKRKPWKLALVFAGVGLGTYVLLRILVPALAGAAPILALIPVLKLLQDKEVERTVVANARGYLGESRVGKALEQLPTGWRVFHDVNLDGENADHMVVGRQGVFNVEVKNYSERVLATPNGLWVNGRRNDKIVRQAWRQAHKLRDALGMEVQPVLVFAGARFEGERVGRLPVLATSGLVPYLTWQTETKLDYERARVVFSKLEALVR